MCDWHARIVVLHHDENALLGGGRRGDHDGRRRARRRQKLRTTTNMVMLAEVPLDPTRLRCLPHPTRDGVDTNNNKYDKYDNNIMVIPPSLPPNMILIQYKDGIIRVMPNCTVISSDAGSYATMRYQQDLT